MFYVYIYIYIYIYEHYERFAHRYEYVHFTYSYLAMVHKEDLALNNLQWLICKKKNNNQTLPSRQGL